MGKINVLRKFIQIFFLISCVFWISCGDHNPFSSNNFSAEEPFSYDLPVTSQSLFQLEGVSGTIVITGETGTNSISIKGKRRVESYSTEDAEQHLELLDVSVESFESKVHVRTIQPNDSQDENYIVDYTITLPKDLEISVVNVSGNIDINSLESIVRLNSVSGNVSLDNISGDTFVELISGRVEGDVSMPNAGTIDLSAISGAIDLYIPALTTAEFSASVVSGSIRITNIELTNIVQTPTSLTGTCGTGDGIISLSTVSGNINVTGF